MGRKYLYRRAEDKVYDDILEIEQLMEEKGIVLQATGPIMVCVDGQEYWMGDPTDHINNQCSCFPREVDGILWREKEDE